MVGSRERKRTKQGERAFPLFIPSIYGRYKEGEKHGETRAMQFAWLEQKDGPPQNIKTHEASQLHQRAALKWQEIQDRRGVLQDFQAAAAKLTGVAQR